MLSNAKGIDWELAKTPPIPKGLVAHFLTGSMANEAINLAEVTLTNALVEAELGGVLSHHLGTDPTRRERSAAPTSETASPRSLC